MMDRVIALLEREMLAKKELILNGSITNYEQYRTALAEYKTFEAAMEIARNAEITDEEPDYDTDESFSTLDI